MRLQTCFDDKYFSLGTFKKHLSRRLKQKQLMIGLTWRQWRHRITWKKGFFKFDDFWAQTMEKEAKTFLFRVRFSLIFDTDNINLKISIVSDCARSRQKVLSNFSAFTSIASGFDIAEFFLELGKFVERLGTSNSYRSRQNSFCCGYLRNSSLRVEGLCACLQSLASRKSKRKSPFKSTPRVCRLKSTCSSINSKMSPVV